MEIDFNKVYYQSCWHEQAIQSSLNCGCFNCLSLFRPDEIVDWVDHPEHGRQGTGKTAVCPRCGVDAVLPDTIGYELTGEFLELMQTIFFG